CVLAAGALLATAGAVEARRTETVARDLNPSAAPLGRICVGDTIARLSIDRIGLETPVREGVDQVTLAHGPGHVPGTALPGEESGRMHAVIATARDAADPFVEKLVVGDRVEVRTPFGPRTYRVVQRRTVPAGELAVGPTDEPTLTLVAPYPSDSVGPAPLRLVVRAKLTDNDVPSSFTSSLTRSTGQSTILAGLAASWAFADGR
ncbi:MAG: class D sortase, partial [Acidobacteriota bacterium]